MPARVPRTTRTTAIVLGRRRLGEADRIVRLLTPGQGKVDAVAKGVLRPRSKLAGHLEPPTHVEVMLAHGRNLDIVTQAQTIEGFHGVRADLARLGTAMYLVEVTDRLTVEHADARPIYDLLHATLVRLDRGDGVHLLTRWFEMQLLEIAGFRPEWEVCVVCGSEVTPQGAASEAVWWSALAGGVLCPRCRDGQAGAEPLDLTVLRLLRAIQRQPHEEVARVRLTSELAAGLERVMHDLVRSVAERDLKSQRFIEAVRRAEAAMVAPVLDAGDGEDASGE